MLTLSGVSKNYGGSCALSEVSLTLSAGEFWGVFGFNGSGKSTLISIAAGAVKPTSGSLSVCKETGWVPQEGGLLEQLSVKDNLLYWRAAAGSRAELFAPGSAESELGLEEISKKRVSRLSGGMKKRLSVACAMAPETRLLLLDEAGEGLDIKYRKRLEELLRRFVKAGGAVLCATHAPERVDELCTHMLVLSGGKVVFCGKKQELPFESVSKYLENGI